MSEVITIGEPLVNFCSEEPDVSLTDALEFHKVMGGAELNVAIGVRKLGHSVEYVTRVGQDPMGKFIQKALAAYDVGTSYVSYDDVYYTGHQMKQLVTQGDPVVVNYRRDSAASHLEARQLEKIDLSDVKIAHTTGIFPAISPIAEKTFRSFYQKLIAAQKLITFDPNLRPSLWKSKDYMIKTINEIAGMADIVLPGINEGKILVGTDNPNEIADFYLNGERTHAVIIKLGDQGVFAKTDQGQKYTIPSFKAEKVVDTVGAGDGFALGLITALLEKKNLKAAAMRGNAVGCLQVQTLGDNDGYPNQEELQQFYAKQGVSEDEFANQA